MSDTCGGIVWVASYPKSGSTWLRIFLENLLTDSSSPIDINRLSRVPHAATRRLFDSITGVEASDLTAEEVEYLRTAVYEAVAERSQSPLFMKIHDAFGYTSEGEPWLPWRATRAAIYVVRNPLDVAPSYAFHRGGSIAESVEIMGDDAHILNDVVGGIDHQLPQRLGSWSRHVESWMDAPGLRVHVVRFEDLKARPLEAFGALARFAGIEYTPTALERAIEHSDFGEVRRQEDVAGFHEGSSKAPRFFRKGEVASWGAELSPSQVEHIIRDHGPVMRRLGYLSSDGEPLP